MRTTIPKTGNQSAHASYGPRSHPPQVTGSRQNQPTVVKRGKRIGSKTSNECNSWLSESWRITMERNKRLLSGPTRKRFIPTSTSKCQPTPSALNPEVCRDNWREQASLTITGTCVLENYLFLTPSSEIKKAIFARFTHWQFWTRFLTPLS
jgi:hypothetical protein